QLRVPGGLAVVVGVDVDPPREHEQSAGIDLPVGPIANAADLADAVSVDGHIGRRRSGAGAVDDCPAPDDEVVHGPTLSPDRYRRTQNCLALPLVVKVADAGTARVASGV